MVLVGKQEPERMRLRNKSLDSLIRSPIVPDFESAGIPTVGVYSISIALAIIGIYRDQCHVLMCIVSVSFSAFQASGFADPKGAIQNK